MSDWMTSNRLKLNPKKAEILKLRDITYLKMFNNVFTTIDTETSNQFSSVPSLVVVLDDEYVSSLCRSCYYECRQLRHTRQYLDFDSASRHVNSFVTGRIDYCNGLLTAALNCQIGELQRVKNSVAWRLLLKLPRFERRLRSMVSKNASIWCTSRSTFTMWFKLIRGFAWAICQSCASKQLITPSTTPQFSRSRTLISSHENLETYGLSAFHTAGPEAWNSQ